MARAAWLPVFGSCCALAACLDIAETKPPDGSGGVIATGGAAGSGGAGGAGGAAGAAGGSAGAAGGAGGADAGAGGSAGAGTDAGDAGPTKTPFGASELGFQRSGDSGANATGIVFVANIPASTRFLIACRHARDNDTTASYPGVMTAGGAPMAAIDPAARGVNGNNQAGVQCFYLDDPPTGSQPVAFMLSGPGSYDYLRISTFYFNRPALIHAHEVATHTAGHTHGHGIVTTEPALVLAVYTKYFTDLVATLGFTELFDVAGFGGEATQYAAVLVQGQPGPANWSVSWSGSSSWGGSQLVAVVPK